MGDQIAGAVKPTHQLGEGIAKQARDAQGYIHPGTCQQRQGNQLQIHQAPAGPIPHRPHPHQGQGLGDVLAAVAHRRRAPDTQGKFLEVFPLLLQVQLQQQFGAAAAQIPGRFRGQTPQIEAVEVAAGGQQVGPAAGGGS